MKHILFILFTLSLGTAYSQLPTRLKLKQLEVGPPNAAVLTDSTGQVIFGTADGNGIYSSSDSIPNATLATVVEGDGSGGDFAIGIWPDWPDLTYNRDEYGIAFARQYDGLLINNDSSNISIYDSDIYFTVNKAGLANYAEIALGAGVEGITMSVDNTNGTFRAFMSNKSIKFAGSSTGIYYGTGAPEGSVTASIGSIYLRQDGGANTSLYVKESGNNTNTGWVGK
jgi:hypothetical protein